MYLRSIETDLKAELFPPTDFLNIIKKGFYAFNMTHDTEHERSLRRSCWDKKVIDYFCEARANWLSGKVCHGEQVPLKRSCYSEHANIMKFRLLSVTQAPRGERQRTLPAGLTVVVQRQLLRGLQQRLQYSVGRRWQEPGDHGGWPGHFLHSASLHRFRNQQRKREIDSADGRKYSAATKTKHTRQRGTTCDCVRWWWLRWSAGPFFLGEVRESH